MKSRPLLFPTLILGLSLLPHFNLEAAPKPKPITGITWDKTPLRIADGTYGRIIRLKDGALLCGYESRGRAWVKRSEDEGVTWNEAVQVRQIAGVNVANAELLQLKNGKVWLFFNGRPRDASNKFSIDACWSDDYGRTWHAREKPIFEAGNEGKTGCWEPAGLQLPSGEIQLFFANEFPFPDNDDQEISMMRSRDNGATWTPPQRVAYRAGHRDGMPVPLLLKDGKTIVFSIEDNGLIPGNVLQPAIISSPRKNSWQGSVDGTSPHRWSALNPPLGPGVYGGAPYIAKLPSGETLLSCQSTTGDWREAKLVVYIGDQHARNFNRPSVPVDLPPHVGGLWNSLFVKNANTVTAVTSGVINGRHGLWAIDGHIERK